MEISNFGWTSSDGGGANFSPIIGIEQLVTLNGIGTLSFLTIGGERVWSANGKGALASTPNFGSTTSIWSPFGSATSFITITLGGVVLTYTVTIGVQFTLGETITNGLGAIGVVTAINSPTSITINISSVAVFAVGNTITGASSGTVATINVGGVVPEPDYFVCSKNIRSLRFYTEIQVSVASTSRWRARIYINGVNSGTGQYWGSPSNGVGGIRVFGVLEYGGIRAGDKISFRIENNTLPASLQNNSSYCVVEYEI